MPILANIRCDVWLFWGVALEELAGSTSDKRLKPLSLNSKIWPKPPCVSSAPTSITSFFGGGGFYSTLRLKSEVCSGPGGSHGPAGEGVGRKGAGWTSHPPGGGWGVQEGGGFSRLTDGPSWCLKKRGENTGGLGFFSPKFSGEPPQKPKLHFWPFLTALTKTLFFFWKGGVLLMRSKMAKNGVLHQKVFGSAQICWGNFVSEDRGGLGWELLAGWYIQRITLTPPNINPPSPLGIRRQGLCERCETERIQILSSFRDSLALILTSFVQKMLFGWNFA